MGAFLQEHFRAAWKKVGTFQVVKVGDRVVEKNGGDVVTYFCTPDLEVIHAVAGKVGAADFLREAKVAVEVSSRMAGKAGAERTEIARRAHAGARGDAPADSRTESVHAKLAEVPLACIDRVARHFFEDVLRERLSDQEVTVTVVDERQYRARRNGLATK